MNREELIRERLKKAFDFLTDEGYEVVSVNMYGSDNYGLNTSKSDMDFKAVVLPSFEEIIRNKKPVSHDIEFEDGLIDIKDVRLMFNNYKKQNTNFLETLVTDYYITNPFYSEEWEEVRNNVNQIAYADPRKAIHAFLGMMKQKYHALFRLYPKTMDEILKYGYCAKQLHHILRLWFMMKKYMSNPIYKNVITFDESTRNYLITLKTEHMPSNEAEELANNILYQAEAFVKEFDKQFFIIDETKYNVFDDVTERMLRKFYGIGDKNGK